MSDLDKGPGANQAGLKVSTLTRDKCTCFNLSFSEYCHAVNRPKYIGRTFDHDGKPCRIIDDDLEDIFSRSDFAGAKRRQR